MTAEPRQPLEVIEGTIDQANERGVRINGQWFNLSQFKPVALPAAGARVSLRVDARRYIQSVEVLSAAPVASDRERRIARLAVLKAAATFLGALSQTRDDIKSDHVTLLAEKWLAWVEA